MNSPETRPNFPRSGDIGGDMPLSTGPSRPPEWLGEAELVQHAERLMHGFKQALQDNPSFRQAAAARVLSDEDLIDNIIFQNPASPIPFEHRGVYYDAWYNATPSFSLLYINRFSEEKSGKRDYVTVRSFLGEDGKTVTIEWAGHHESGKDEILVNTPTAIEEVEAFLRDLQAAA